MTQPALPAKQPQWADTGIVTEPSTPYKSAGWTAVKPPFAYFNWFMNLVYQWTQYLNAKVNFLPGTLADEVLTITANLVTATQANSTFGAVTANLYGNTYTNFTTGGLWLCRGNGTNPITVFHQQTAAPAYFRLAGNQNVVLNDAKDYILFQLNADGYWYEITRSASLPHAGIQSYTAGAITLANGDETILVNSTAGASSMTLPTAANNKGKMLRIKKTDSSANAITISTTGGQTVDGLTSVVLGTQYATLEVISDGTNWSMIQPGYAPSQTLINGGASASSATTYTSTPTPAFGAYYTGMFVSFKAVLENSGPSTLNVSGLGAKNLLDREGAALVGGEIHAGQNIVAVYDGTSFIALTLLATAEVFVYTGNGYGSTNTKIRRFTTAGVNIGTAITYTASATNGDTFTINKSGQYAVSYGDVGDSAFTAGISLNSNQLTTGYTSITTANRLTTTRFSNVQSNMTSPVVLNLKSGDVLRAHGDALENNTSFDSNFRVTRIG
jgi:hypothetical protein